MSDTIVTPVFTLEGSLRLIVASMNADVAEKNAVQTADDTFKASSTYCAGLLTTVNAVEAAEFFKNDATGSETAYGSANMVRYHGITGQYLSLEGSLPEGIRPKNVQTDVKIVGMDEARSILAQSRDLTAAWKKLHAAANKKSGRGETSDKSATDRLKLVKKALVAALARDDFDAESMSELNEITDMIDVKVEKFTAMDDSVLSDLESLV